MSTAIVWLRRDLRLDDNPALAAAGDRHDRVIPVYIHCPGEAGDWPPGAARQWWLHHALRDFDRSLRAIDSRLIVQCGPSAALLAAMVRETGASAVYWNRLHEPALRTRDARVHDALKQEFDLEVESFAAALLFEPGTITTGDGRPPRVFTPFWRRIANQLPARPLPPVRQLPAPDAWPHSQAMEALELLPEVARDAGLRASWQPGEQGARERLQTLVDERLADYDQARDRPACAGTSRLSPHLHGGEVSPRRVVAAVRAAAAGDVGEALLRELGWREFAAHLLHHFPHTANAPLDAKFERFPWRDIDGQAGADLRAWQTGTTGIPLVDAGMRQLWYSGWMHNRVRMVVASFLCKNLRIHWLHGARWFWHTLVDADLASNTLGWQWTAGCGADAAPYFRIFNPERQARRFDPDGDYIRQWVPEAGTARYPDPIVDLGDSRRQALAAFRALRDS